MRRVPVLEISNLSFSYDGKNYALEDINLSTDIPSGILSVLGPNGAGKTTLVNILTTTFKPQKGTAKIFDLDVVKNKKKIREMISLCAQDLELDVLLSVRTNLKFYGMIRGIPKNELERRLDDIIEMFGLTEHQHKRVLELSGGLRRRTQLARAFLDPRTRLIFIDEPTLGLDPIGKKITWDLIREMSKEGYYFILTTNDMTEVESLSDEIVFIHKGKIILHTTLKEFKHVYAGKVMVTFKKELFPQVIEILSNYLRRNNLGKIIGKNTVELEDKSAFYELLLFLREIGFDITQIVVKEETLLDGFIKLIGGIKQ